MKLLVKNLQGTLDGKDYRIGISCDGSFLQLDLYFSDHGPEPVYWLEKSFPAMYGENFRTYSQAFQLACGKLKNAYSINLLS